MKCDNCRYTKMCVRRFHTMGDTVNCGHYEEYEQRPHGEWIEKTGMRPPKDKGVKFCSNCMSRQPRNLITHLPVTPSYCPNCGADMRGEKDD